ncbi:hypothetical protein SLEP1_g58199, partial [Rubroshorea leprosula]
SSGFIGVMSAILMLIPIAFLEITHSSSAGAFLIIIIDVIVIKNLSCIPRVRNIPIRNVIGVAILAKISWLLNVPTLNATLPDIMFGVSLDNLNIWRQ